MALGNWRPDVTCVCVVNVFGSSTKWMLPLHTQHPNGHIWVADNKHIQDNYDVPEDEIVAVLKIKRVNISNLNDRK
jgi:hypothetical protein